MTLDVSGSLLSLIHRQPEAQIVGISPALTVLVEAAARQITERFRSMGMELSLRMEPNADRLDAEVSLPLSNGAELCLDYASVRTLTDLVALQLKGMRGLGEPTDTDLGLLEALAVEATDSIADLVGDRNWGVSQVHRTVSSKTDQPSFRFQLSGAGRSGAATIFLPGWSSKTATLFGAGSRPSEETQMTVVLPSIQVDAQALKALSPGDLLGLGQSGDTLWTAFPGASLMTTSGWTLGTAQVLASSKSSLTVAPGPLRPRVQTPPKAPQGRENIVITAGDRDLEREELLSWQEAQPITLALSEGRVQLHRAGFAPVEAEPVASEAGLGLRLVTLP